MSRVIVIIFLLVVSHFSLAGQNYSRVYPNANGRVSTLVVHDSLIYTACQDYSIRQRAIVRKMDRAGNPLDSLIIDYDPTVQLAGTWETSLEYGGSDFLFLNINLIQTNADTISSMLYIIDMDMQILNSYEYRYAGYARTQMTDMIFHNDTLTIIGENSTGLQKREFFITSFDTAFNVLSERTYMAAGQLDYLPFRIVHHNDHYYVSGVLIQYSVSNPHGDAFLVKTDLNGDIIWLKTYVSFYSSGVPQIAFFNDTLHYYRTDPRYVPTSGDTYDVARFCKLDTAGSILVDTLYLQDTLQSFDFRDVEFTQQGKAVVVGHFFHQGNPIGIIYILNRELETIHYNTYRYATQSGSFLHGVEVFSDGSILGGGLYANLQASPYKLLVWLLALDSNGCIGTYCGDNVLGVAEFPKPILARVFPNPADEVVTIEAPQAGDSSFGYAFIDMQGRTLKEGTLKPASGQAELNISELPSGHYQLILVFGRHLDVHPVVKL